MNVRLGISYNVDIIDYILNFNLGSNAILILPVGILFFFLYYFSFKWVIMHDNVLTPGRAEEDTTTAEITDDEKNFTMNNTNNEFVAKKMLQNLGGNAQKVETDKIRQMGVKGVVFLTDTNLQVVVGTSVQKVKAAMDELL